MNLSRRLMLTTLACWLLVSTQASAEEQCVVPHSGGLTRRLGIKNIAVWIASDATYANFNSCISSNKCVWRFDPGRIEDFGAIGSYAAGRECSQSPYFIRSSYRSDCSLGEDVDQELGSLSYLISSIFAKFPDSCEATQKSFWIGMHQGATIVIQKLIRSEICILVYGGTRAVVVLLRDQCANSADEAKAALSRVRTLGASGDKSWLAMDISFGLMAVAIYRPPSATVWKISSELIIETNLVRRSYAEGWLRAVTAISKNSALALPTVGDPVPWTDSSEAGRLLRFFTALVVRQRSLHDKIIRDWMARVALLDPNGVNAAIWRPELAGERR